MGGGGGPGSIKPIAKLSKSGSEGKYSSNFQNNNVRCDYEPNWEMLVMVVDGQPHSGCRAAVAVSAVLSV